MDTNYKCIIHIAKFQNCILRSTCERTNNHHGHDNKKY